MRKHIKIDAALGLFPKKAQKYVVIIGDLLFLFFAVYVAYTGFGYSIKQTRVSSAMSIPFKYVYISTFFGFGLAAFRQIQTIIYRIRCIKNGEEYEG
jgi:TRAP-type C4-dicarboxylate transport system permease small subunit